MVEFKLTKEQLLAKELFRSFAENEIKPISRDMDEAEKFDMDLLDKMKKYGLMGIPYSKEYGGEGADVLTYALAMEEVSKVDASAGITISVHTSLCCSCINDYASEEQKQKFLRPLVDGSKIGCFGLTEPGAGTDASGVKTTAKLDGDHYVLNGQKVFTTNSGFADTFIIFAYTDKSAGTRGMSAFIVDRDSEGLTVSKDIPRMGIRAASNAEVALVDVKVPKENLIGREGMGYKITMGALAGGRIGIGAQSVGIAQGAAKAKDDHENFAPLAAQCKLFASDVAVEVTRGAVQMLGGYGYSREYPVERMYRDAKITEIYEGTSEAMKMIVGGGLLR